MTTDHLYPVDSVRRNAAYSRFLTTCVRIRSDGFSPKMPTKVSGLSTPPVLALTIFRARYDMIAGIEVFLI